ncbi:MAG: phosphoglucosamine mutase [Acidobacteria bacterium]|nr:phosphoglucosamine mutase [Acidobacteriota bacterium]
MTSRLFGTDGVRGRAGVYPLDVETVRRLGAALIRALPRSDGARVVIGRDTRESGGWIERELAHGARFSGATVVSAGVISTPAVAFLTRTEGYSAGVVISASHNPFEDNGIKVFSGAGEKFTERLEQEVEGIVADRFWQVPSDPAAPVAVHDFSESYLEHVRSVLRQARSVRGWTLAVDCANGATSDLAPRLFRELGLHLDVIGASPDGRNINLGVGSTHPDGLAALVRERGSRLGVAFDGDGDRAIFADETGQIVNGDAVMLMCAKHLKREGRLRGNALVATVMSNLGLELGLKDLGLDLVRCPVGDKYVMEELLARNLSLGGEQSGHVIFSDFLFTGDGLITAMQVLETMAATGRKLSELAGELVVYPQVLLNVRVRERVDLKTVPPIASVMDGVERRLGRQGRLLVRYSGTEPLLRIMLEGRDQEEINRWAEEIAREVRKQIGM